MNLRETLQNIALHDGCIDLSDFSADAMINEVREYYGFKDLDVTMIGSAHEVDIRADERNKVLDAAIDECYQWFKQAETEELSFDDLIARIEAINKLRGD